MSTAEDSLRRALSDKQSTIDARGNAIRQLKSSGASKSEIDEAVKALNDLKLEKSAIESQLIATISGGEGNGSIVSKEEIEEEEKDRISALLDCLILEILSRLPETKDAITTGTLSKRWKYVWTRVHNLIFVNNKDSQDFYSLVDQTLIQCHQLKLEKFELVTKYDIQFESQVNNWIRYAVDRNVEELILTLWNMEDNECLLHDFFYTNSSLTDVKLSGCVINPTAEISWNRLKSLCLSCTQLDEHLIESILSGSPLLETLELGNCHGYRRIDVTSKSVKNLVFSGYTYPEGKLDDTDVIEINAPYILSLRIEDDLCLWKILLLNVASLVKADLDFIKGGFYETTRKEAGEEMLKGFILNLRHVKELTIGNLCFQALSRLEAKGFIFPSNLKVLDVTYPLYSDSDSE